MICKKLIDNDEEKVRDHCYVTGKFRGAAHKICNVNFQLTKKGHGIFHNLRGHDSHLFFNELDKFHVKIEVKPNGLEKYMTFSYNKNLVFIDSMQFMNSSLDKLAKNFEMKNMRNYHDHYLQKDVLLLVDVFEKFIDMCLKDYDHYFSSPGLSWDAMLKMTDIELEKISDIGLFIGKGLGGGISYISKRYSKANDKYLNDYDPKKPSTFITYLDMNNLDG